MRRITFFLSLTALYAVSCNEISIPDHQSMNLDIDVRTAVETKSLVAGSTLPSGSSVGLFVTDDSETTYDGIAVANIRYTGIGEGESQAWAADEDIMLSATKGTLKGYYPYSENVTDITAIPVQATSDVQDDWMYATPVANLNNKNYSAIMTMNHALAARRLSLVKGSYNGVGEITSVSFSSDGAATNAVLNATDGSLSSITGAGALYISNEVFYLIAEKKSVDFITVPTGNAASIVITVNVNGTDMVAETEEVILESGKFYEYTLAIGTEGVFLNRMNVIDWSFVDKGTLELAPEELKVPDPFIEWARIQHKDGTLYTAEEWLAAESAGTVTDADANGVAVLYSKYAVCPHIIYPKVSADKPKWSSNSSVEVPGVTTASDEATAQLDVNGKANTEAILAAIAAGTIKDAPAAQYCVDVTFANGQQGYLPAAGELQAWFDNKTAVNACMDAIGGDQVATFYWSSTQFEANYAWGQYSDRGEMKCSRNDYSNYVRPVVAFEYN